MKIAITLIISCFGAIALCLPTNAQEMGKATLIDFQASWCGPCHQLEHVLNKVEKKYGDQLKVVSIDVDNPANRALVEEYGVSSLPTVVFLAADGSLASMSTGYQGENTLDWGLKSIISKPDNR